MDYKALIDFNKYTLAIAAAGFVYVLEKFSANPGTLIFSATVFMHALFLVSALAGILLFATSTNALHHPDDESQSQNRIIEVSGIVHAGCLIVAMIVLGVLVFSKYFLAEPKPISTTECCCQSQIVETNNK